jgi:hypothetical protein
MIKVSIPLGSGLLPPNVDQGKAVFNSFIAAGRASIGPGVCASRKPHRRQATARLFRTFFASYLLENRK